MKPLKKTFILEEIDYYKKHFEILNTILPVQLTNKDIEVLTHFILIEGKEVKDCFGTMGKKIVQERCKISKSNLHDTIKKFENKGYIKRINNELYFNPIVLPNNKEQIYNFKLIVKDEDV